MKNKKVTNADKAKQKNGGKQAFQLKDEGLLVINSNGIAQIKHAVIDFIHGS